MNAKLSKTVLILGTVAVLGSSAAAASDVTVTYEPMGRGGFSDIHAGLTKDEIRDLVGKPASVRENARPGLTRWTYKYTDVYGDKVEYDVYFDAHGKAATADSVHRKF